MQIASVKRSATVAWGPSSEHATLLAAGTVAGAISESFDASHKLVSLLHGQAVPSLPWLEDAVRVSPHLPQ